MSAEAFVFLILIHIFSNSHPTPTLNQGCRIKFAARYRDFDLPSEIFHKGPKQSIKYAKNENVDQIQTRSDRI